MCLPSRRLVPSRPRGYDASMARITPTQAAAYLARWRDVSRQEAADLRATPVDVKFRQLCALLESRAIFPADPDRDARPAALVARWGRIRKHYGD